MTSENMKIQTVPLITQKLQSYSNSSDTLMILGSGWNEVVNDMDIQERFGFDEVFGARTGVVGHKGELILGKLSNQLVWIMAGRFHTYEGYTSEEVTRPVQAFAQLGVEQVILTSASGGLNGEYQVGDIVVLNDIMTIFCQSPIEGSDFVDLSQPFDPNLRHKAIKICQKNQINWREGVYVYMRAPHFESFSDKRALTELGADCVGMSTVPETIMANKLGLKVLGLSCVTNLSFVKHDHKQVVSNAIAQSAKMMQLLTGVIG
ncbi:purine-nucleoside phosphorylase [Candidatus Beckwithbacteria bacterium CG23_combo_of_CG06-09_8_20_14_all_34_8]|uniref:purine-nucleoside phosphorylase n=1 Tax=Candidatus Beckwithbacteria bacterium CG23_combo_of_CG06-09_8_20_14_all_34_8 TaxID=1974497 RepID=A0A2H0B688_9BACT|nr:MAG: purine-nucleoside phosphorylase [Candidatus Beckwithbacteria bacterium CG23_combo_of_CG06-09_8_20_14_all_34_8]